jgi:hypothetical protein
MGLNELAMILLGPSKPLPIRCRGSEALCEPHSRGFGRRECYCARANRILHDYLLAVRTTRVMAAERAGAPVAVGTVAVVEVTGTSL